MNRREMMAALPAAALVPAAALSGEILPPITETPVMALYRKWESIFAVQNGAEGERLTEAEHGRLDRQRWALEDAIFETPPQNAADVLAKVAARSNLGDHPLPDMKESPAFWQDLRDAILT
ncbi:hypothetical protein [Paracoccus homiensis]|uniref:Tat (Twin-arginine translocation) pathway signal sequence n=1 Tax=Paracoccus homiensis TaxID=364199 RepID=A0A1I0GUJ0_9RHOB|nr:hypothetical protein [Paracoccus homiensis]SET74862.1 hypothetical protein SAMN04489858_10989 [Paracoccus homiensis]